MPGLQAIQTRTAGIYAFYVRSEGNSLYLGQTGGGHGPGRAGVMRYIPFLSASIFKGLLPRCLFLYEKKN